MGKFNQNIVPKWCKWIAVDEDGECWAFSYMPTAKNCSGEWDAEQQSLNLREKRLYCGKPPKNWKDELYTWR